MKSLVLKSLLVHQGTAQVINYGTDLPPEVIEKWGIRDPKHHRATGIHDIPLEDIY